MIDSQENHSTAHNDHGSAKSYVIGLILSLALTVIPYYMVTQSIMSGTTLLLIILGLAIVQMLVQIFFFLHLGRGPKPLYNIVFFCATAALIILVIGASLLIMNNLYRNMSPQETITRLAQEENIAEINGKSTGACQGNNANHTVIIKDARITEQTIEARRCDTLTIVNEDGTNREFMFSTNGLAASYGGVYDVAVRADRYKVITLNELGTFNFYDSTDNGIAGTFIVTP